uniref:Uncharacterized protein n=1 Tax=Steinernema glaseri TaxID=37863 RepID=A0A1I7ZB03_9BILA
MLIQANIQTSSSGDRGRRPLEERSGDGDSERNQEIEWCLSALLNAGDTPQHGRVVYSEANLAENASVHEESASQGPTDGSRCMIIDVSCFEEEQKGAVSSCKTLIGETNAEGGLGLYRFPFSLDSDLLIE